MNLKNGERNIRSHGSLKKDCPAETLAHKAQHVDFNKDEVEMDEVVVKPGGSTGGVGLTMSSFGKKGGSGKQLGGSGNLNIWQAAARNIGRNDANRKKVDDLNTFMQGVLLTGVAPLAVSSAPAMFAFSTELWGVKAGLSWGAQALINGINEVDYADVAGDAFTAPGLNALWSGGVDVKPLSIFKEERFRIQGIHNSKSGGQFWIDASIGLGFGVATDATWKPLGSMLKTPTEKSVFYISTQSGIGLGQQGAGRVISNQQK